MTAVLAGLAVLAVLGLPAPSRLALVPRTAPPPRWFALPAVVVAAVLVGPVGAVVLLGLGLLGRRAWVRRKAAAEREAERAGAAEALAVLGAELRAGRAPAEALLAAAGVAVGGLAEALASAAAVTGFGGDVPDSLARSADGSAVPEVLQGLGACWQVCGATGSSLAAAVDRLAEGHRAERVQRLAVDAELAGPRATAALLAGLPVLGIALAAGLGARPLHVLLHTPVGAGCLVLGLGLDLLGLWWTGRLVAAAGGVR